VLLPRSPDHTDQGSGIRDQGSGIRGQSGTREQGSGASQGPGNREQGSGASQGSGIREQRPVRDQGSLPDPRGLLVVVPSIAMRLLFRFERMHKPIYHAAYFAQVIERLHEARGRHVAESLADLELREQLALRTQRDVQVIDVGRIRSSTKAFRNVRWNRNGRTCVSGRSAHTTPCEETPR